jgi:ABC-type cobalamin transport system permease subunit
MPSERAFGGMSERKRRAGLERREKGLKVTRTSVRKRVIITAVGKVVGISVRVAGAIDMYTGEDVGFGLLRRVVRAR